MDVAASSGMNVSIAQPVRRVGLELANAVSGGRRPAGPARVNEEAFTGLIATAGEVSVQWRSSHFTGKGMTTASDSVAPRCFGPQPRISDPSVRTSTE